MAKSDSSKAQQQIGFRVPPSFADELTRRGAKTNLSRHEYARQLVVESIADTSTARILSRMDQLEKKYERRWEDLVNAVANLFVHAGKLDVDDAAGWIEENMPH